MKEKKNIFKNIFSLENSLKKVKHEQSESESWIYHILTADADVPHREEEKDKKPFALLSLAAVFMFLVLFGRLYFLQIVAGSEQYQKAEGNKVRSRVVRAPRGIIYDKNGTPLVKNIPNFEVVVVPTDLPQEDNDRRDIFDRLSELIKIPKEEIEKKIKDRGYASSLPVVVSKSIEREEALVLESRLSEFKGVSVQVNPIREYLDDGLLPHVLGYAGRISEKEYKGKENIYEINDYIGKTGLEFSYEKNLKGANGEEREQVDATGKVIKIMGEKEPENGDNLVLSLDFELQRKMTEALQAGLEKAKAKKGVAIAQNPKTGEILAMVDLPSYDNNLFAKGISDTDYKKLTEDTARPLVFRAISGEYPSGSTIKPYVASAALEEGVVNENTTVLSKGGIKIGDWEFPDWKPGGHGVTNIIKAIAQSVNTFFYAIGGGYENIKGLGAVKINEYLEKFGFGKTTGVDVPGEAEGNIPDPEWKERVKSEPWYLGDTYHMAIGQGDVLVTPIQMVNAVSAVANGGTLFKPRFVDKITNINGEVKEELSNEVANKDFISKDNIDIVRRGMREAIVSGSGRALNDLPVEVAGKTGTAQFSNDLNKKHAWFTAFAPYNDPQISIVVLIEEGGEGSDFAAPVAKEVLGWYFSR